MNIDMDCDNKVDEKDYSDSPKYILKKKIITKRNLMSLDLEEHQTPLDLSDKSKVNAIPHGSKEFITEHYEPQNLYQTPTIQVVHHRSPSNPLIASAHNHVRGPVSPVRISSSHIFSSNSLPKEPLPPVTIFPSNSLPKEPLSPASTTAQVFSLGRFISQPHSRSQCLHEDPDDLGSPNSIASQSFPYSEEELVRYPKGTLRRQRILQNTLSEAEASQRERTINNESSRRYRQRKHMAQKQLKEEEELLKARQVELKEKHDDLQHETDLYYSYFRRTYF